VFSPWELTQDRPRSFSDVKLQGDKLVRFIYVDESGISANEPSTVVAGIIVKGDKQWRAVEECIAGLIKKYVREEHRDGFIFHAHELFSGTGKVFGDRIKYPRERRTEALKALLAIPSRFHMALVFGFERKNPAEETPTKEMRRQAASKHQATAFASCVMAAEKYMRLNAGRNEIATLVAENNTDTRKMVEWMHQVLRGRTRGAQGIFKAFKRFAPGGLPITKIVDTVHFVRKSDAFLLQIADACALIARYHFENKPNIEQFFAALTDNKPDRLQIGTWERGGYSIVDFSRISCARMYARVLLPVPWGILKILTKPLWKKWRTSRIRNP
jgi:hypothetical protein